MRSGISVAEVSLSYDDAKERLDLDPDDHIGAKIVSFLHAILLTMRLDMVLKMESYLTVTLTMVSKSLS
jgi:hypothetical protein